MCKGLLLHLETKIIQIDQNINEKTEISLFFHIFGY